MARERPGLALADVRFADGSDGLAAAKEVQEQFKVPAIAVTGHLPLPRLKRRASWGILGKPYTSYALRAVLDGAAVWLGYLGEQAQAALEMEH